MADKEPTEEEKKQAADEAARVAKEAEDAAKEAEEEEIVDLSAVLERISEAAEKASTKAVSGLATKEDLAEVKTFIADATEFIREARKTAAAAAESETETETDEEKQKLETGEHKEEPEHAPAKPRFLERLPRWLL